jgi:hypothetical protein
VWSEGLVVGRKRAIVEIAGWSLKPKTLGEFRASAIRARRIRRRRA